MLTWLLASSLFIVQAPPPRLTPIEQAKAWDLVKMALPDSAKRCEREVVRNNRGEGIVVRCGAATPDPLAPTPMVFLVLDGRAYAASLLAGALTDLPDLSVSDEARRRAGFSLFVEVVQRRGNRGLETSWQYFHYDPRPVVCIPGAEQATPADFIPAQRPRKLPEQVVSHEIADAMRVVESRGRIVVLTTADQSCSLTVDRATVDASNEDAITARARLQVWEAGVPVYEETLTKEGDEIGDVGEEVAADAVTFLRNNYARLSQRGVPPSKPKQ